MERSEGQEEVVAVEAPIYRGPDRRQRPTPWLSRYTFLGGRRRSGGRRPGEDRNAFVDLYSSRLLVAAAAVMILNFLDAWFTMLFLSHGGQELNPVMNYVLQFGVWPFIFVKSLGIGLCVVVLTITKNFRFAQMGTAAVLGGYLLLLMWHLFLYTHLDEWVA